MKYDGRRAKILFNFGFDGCKWKIGRFKCVKFDVYTLFLSQNYYRAEDVKTQTTYPTNLL
jgi:hypothetical protein